MKVRRASSHSSMDTLARCASPGIEPHTRPAWSAIASMVIQVSRVPWGSHQTVDSVMLLNSFVNVLLTPCPFVM